MIDIMHRMAVVVVLHVRGYVRLVMSEVIGSMIAVVVREVIPVVRRTPIDVVCTTETVEQRRALVVDRLDDIVNAIYVRCTYNLHIRRAIAHFYDYGSYILIDVCCQHGLNEQDVVVALNGLQDAQVVDIAVVVEVEVRDDIGVGVQNGLELLHAVCLCKGGSYGLQIEIQTYVLRHGIDVYSSCTRATRARVRNGSANGRIDGLRLSDYDGSGLNDNGFGSRCNSYNTRHTATGEQKRQR